jgi:hypothetical protein
MFAGLIPLLSIIESQLDVICVEYGNEGAKTLVIPIELGKARVNTKQAIMCLHK